VLHDSQRAFTREAKPLVAMSSMLIVVGGLPGTGKTSLARALARAHDAVHVRIDTNEQAIRASIGGEAPGVAGYVAAQGIAEDNLRLGRIVVADCVNPLASARAAWRAVGNRAGVAVLEVELVCSDALEHRRRIETRRAGVSGPTLPTWDDVMTRAYEPWEDDHVVIDTARRPLEQSVVELHALLLRREGAAR
jgi:predicted kinase